MTFPRLEPRSRRRGSSAARPVVVLGIEFAGAFGGAMQHVLARHSGPAAAPQDEEPAADHGHDHNENDDGSKHYEVILINPSCAALDTNRPSRAKTLPRVNPRAPEALGLSIAYNSQSSTRTLR